jgi:hypothetical protein
MRVIMGYIFVGHADLRALSFAASLYDALFLSPRLELDQT